MFTITIIKSFALLVSEAIRVEELREVEYGGSIP